MKLLSIILPIIILIASCSARPEYYREAKDGNIYWNPSRPLKIAFADMPETNGLKALLRTSSNKIELNVADIRVTPTNIMLVLTPPPDTTLADGTDTLEIRASNGQVLTNNLLVIDTEYPSMKITGCSPVVKKGGAALVIFEAVDPNLKPPYVLVGGEERFYTQQYRRNGQYAGFFVWPVTMDTFHASVIATDKAGNTVTNRVPIEAKKIKYPVSYLNIDNEFHNDKLDEFGESPTNRNLTEEERYRMIVKGFQDKKDINIVDLTVKKIVEKTDAFQPLPFDPLPKAKITSPFGEHRYFLMKNKTVRNSYHLGLDMARSTNADIFSSDAGMVVYSGYNGANGNMILVYHGTGIYSLYAHCSKMFVRAYDRVSAGQKIAVSGKTGYALGDHLHFSILVQGRYANPLEWMDAEWIESNVTAVSTATR